MILNKIILENIRSYQSQEIQFLPGTTLLCGDVGAGKSTILLAIDFALFGIQKGTLNGETLLRKGSKIGSVELHSEIEGKQVIIKRTLKQGTSITQEAAMLTINGISQHVTPVEIKQRILELLHYPAELLTKSKALIYRYTVYTPQEEMKHILYADNEVRLDTLRKIFGIDKYKRIKENTKIYTSYLRDQKKLMEGQLHDYAQKKNIYSEILEKLEKTKTETNLLAPQLLSLETEEKNLELQYKSLEEQFVKNATLEGQKNSLEHQLNEKIMLIKNLQGQLQNLSLQEIEKPQKFSEEELITKQQQHTNLSQQQRTYEQELNTLQFQLNASEKLILGVQQLQECPTCKQEVSSNHKNHIANKEQEKTQQLKVEHEKIASILEKLSKEHQTLTSYIETLKNTKNERALLVLKYQHYQESKRQKTLLEEHIITLKKDIGMINTSLLELSKQLTKTQDLQEQRKILQDSLSKKRQERQNLNMQTTRLSTLTETLNLQQEQLTKELREKENAQEQLTKTGELASFLQDSFIPSLESMEHQVLLKIHHDFNTFYTQWFTLLMGSEDILTRLDEAFTPSIEQNGHTIEYSNLSGGEQTAVALAYRLALNHVINTLMVDITTRDLLILDEPTDGFSGEQIDRIQLILEELNIKQVILVSHEPKIEGFVDHIIRIEKQSHTSIINND